MMMMRRWVMKGKRDVVTMRRVVTTPDSGGWMLDQGLPQPKR